MSKKKVMSVLWQEWQVWGIITETWKVCVSTSGHLRRIDPHRAAAGLMSTVSPASNEERAIATVFHQPSALSVQHPIIPEHTAWAAEQHRISCHTSMKKQYGVGEGICEMALSQVQSWKHCDWVFFFRLTWYSSTLLRGQQYHVIANLSRLQEIYGAAIQLEVCPACFQFTRLYLVPFLGS